MVASSVLEQEKGVEAKFNSTRNFRQLGKERFELNLELWKCPRGIYLFEQNK